MGLDERLREFEQAQKGVQKDAQERGQEHTQEQAQGQMRESGQGYADSREDSEELENSFKKLISKIDERGSAPPGNKDDPAENRVSGIRFGIRAVLATAILAVSVMVEYMSGL